jgi:N-acetylglucosamine-6-phosphate deacetylase
MNLSVCVRGALSLGAAVGLGVTSVVVSAAGAQVSTAGSPLAPPPNGPRREEPAAVVIRDCTAHVRPGETLEHATLVVEGGRIVGVAAGDAGAALAKAAPAWAAARDGAGLHVYAGFLEPWLEIDVPRPDPEAPGSHWNVRVTPQRSALDRGAAGIDKGTAETLRGLGFVAAAVAPKGGIFQGSAAVVSLAERPEDPSLTRPAVYRDGAYQLVSFELAGERGGEDGRWGGYPDSQMGAIALIRQTLSDADWWKVSGADGGGARNALSALAPAQGKAPRLMVNAADELEVLRAGKIASEFGRELAVIGSGHEYRRLEAIARGKWPVVLPLAFPKPPKVGSVGEQEATELRDLIDWEQAPTNPRRVDAAGLTVALTTGKLPDKLGGRGVFRENLQSAIKHGLKPDRALAMLTTNAAQVLGVEDRFGTLEKGKVASFVVADGDLFDVRPDMPKKGEPGFRRPARIVETWIDGRRHEIAPRAHDELEGTWSVTIEPGPKAGSGVAIGYEIVNDPPALVPTITLVKTSRDDKGAEQRATTAAKELAIEEDARLRFVFDHTPFGEPGVFVATGVIEKGEGGAPVMRGDAVRSGGERLRWTAVRTSAEKPKATNSEGSERKAEGSEKKGEAKDAAGAAPAGEEKKPGEGKDDVKKDEKPGSMTEAESIAQIPERLGLPVGPYATDGLPPQGTVLLRHATVWTCADAGVINDGVVLLSEGKIAFVGSAPQWDDFAARARLKAPAREIDLAGRHVTPGIVDCHSHTGISKGVNEAGQAVTAEVRIGDVTDPDSISWYRQLGGGVTSVNSLHGSANPMGGQNQVNKNRWGCAAPDDMHFEGAIPGIKFALGENVKQSNWGDRNTTRYPQTRMGVETLMRDRFQAAREYLKAGGLELAKGARSDGVTKSRSDGVGDAPAPDASPTSSLRHSVTPSLRRDLELEALAEILDGKRLIHCHSYRQDEILMLCRLADEFGFKVGTFQHGLEVYKVADVVKTHAIGASIFADWWGYKVEVQDAIPYAGPLQTGVGVLTSYNSDSDEMARRLNVEAGKAVKYSDGKITPEEALKFVTINPARQLRIDGRVGSLEAGKDADVAVWSGPPLSSLSRCERTFVDGRELFSLEKDAAARKTIASERARIMQKALALSAAGERARGEKKDKGPETSGERNADPKKPTGADDLDADELAAARASGRGLLIYETHRRFVGDRRERYLDLINRALDPRFHTAGACGCQD